MERAREPVVIRLHHELFPEFQGLETDVLEVYRFVDNAWSLVPYQIDEITAGLVDIKDYYGAGLPGNYCVGEPALPPELLEAAGPCEYEYEAISRFPSVDNGRVSDNDELVFLAYHTGRCDAPVGPDPSVGLADTRYRIEITNNNGLNSEKGCVYLYARESGTSPSPPDLIAYDTEDDGGPSACLPVPDACGSIISGGDLDEDGIPDVTPYRVDFYGNWTMEGLQIGETALDPSQDMIDISKWRIESPAETEHLWDGYQDNSRCAIWLGYIDGPVRVVRVIQAAQSGGTTRKYEYAYPGEIVTQVFMRVHLVTGPIYSYLDIDDTTTSSEIDRAKLYKDGYTLTPYDEIGEAVEPPTCDKGNPVTCFRPHEWFAVSTSIGSFLQYYRVKTGEDAEPTVGSEYADSDSNIWPPGRDDEHAPEWDFVHEDHFAALTTYSAIADSQNRFCDLSRGDPLVDDVTLVTQSTRVMLSAGHASGSTAQAEYDRRNRGVFGVCVANDSGNGSCPGVQLQVDYDHDGGVVHLTPQPLPGCDLTAWNLYRQVGAGVWKRIATTPGSLVFKDATLTLGEQATYAASGYGSNCVESSHSNPIAILHDDIVPPGPPVDPDAEAGPGEITVRWSRPGDADVVGYKVLVASEASGPFTQVHVGVLEEMSTTYSFSAASGDYYVAVRAVDHAGNQGELSLPVEVVMP